jgi:hypothetical protein
VVVEEESIGDEELSSAVGREGLNVGAEDDARSTEQRCADVVGFVLWDSGREAVLPLLFFFGYDDGI